MKYFQRQIQVIRAEIAKFSDAKPFVLIAVEISDALNSAADQKAKGHDLNAYSFLSKAKGLLWAAQIFADRWPPPTTGEPS